MSRKRTARPARREKRHKETDYFVDEIEDDNEIQLDNGPVPDVLQPPERRKFDVSDEHGYNPLIVDADQGEEIDKWIVQNYPPHRWEYSDTILEERRSSVSAVMNWMEYRARQSNDLYALIRRNDLENSKYRDLVDWFRKRPLFLSITHAAVRRHFYDNDLFKQ